MSSVSRIRGRRQATTTSAPAASIRIGEPRGFMADAPSRGHRSLGARDARRRPRGKSASGRSLNARPNFVLLFLAGVLARPGRTARLRAKCSHRSVDLVDRQLEHLPVPSVGSEKLVDLDVSTRFLRFSSPRAAFNRELSLFSPDFIGIKCRRSFSSSKL